MSAPLENGEVDWQETEWKQAEASDRGSEKPQKTKMSDREHNI